MPDFWGGVALMEQGGVVRNAARSELITGGGRSKQKN
jgi:hypothetical protein